jgi:GNAT superfamily N-acetyltransferase
MEQAHIVNVDGAWLCAGIFREAGGEPPPGMLRVLWGVRFGGDDGDGGSSSNRERNGDEEGKSQNRKGKKGGVAMQAPPISLSDLPLGNAVFMLVRAMHAFPCWIEWAKTRALGRERVRTFDYYNLIWLGTLPEARGCGLASAFVRMVTKKAAEFEKPVPVWLETSTANARRLYKKCGFEVVAATRFGRGWVDEDGAVVERNLRRTRAKGVKMWAMLWWPEELQEERLDVRHKSKTDGWIEK